MLYFRNQKSQFGKILEGLRIEKVGIFYGHLEYFAPIWYILWPFGNVVVIWYIPPDPPFWYILCQEKSGNPGAKAIARLQHFPRGRNLCRDYTRFAFVRARA
jgi:hypothetical protein